MHSLILGYKLISRGCHNPSFTVINEHCDTKDNISTCFCSKNYCNGRKEWKKKLLNKNHKKRHEKHKIYLKSIYENGENILKCNKNYIYLYIVLVQFLSTYFHIEI